MISKELLSEVLGYRVLSNILIQEEIIIKLNFEYFQTKYENDEINIYELAHKCKEWALSKGYELRTSTIGIVDVYDHIYIDKEDGLTGVFINCRKEADTEPEAIFKACEYIMENKCGS